MRRVCHTTQGHVCLLFLAARKKACISAVSCALSPSAPRSATAFTCSRLMWGYGHRCPAALLAHGRPSAKAWQYMTPDTRDAIAAGATGAGAGFLSSARRCCRTLRREADTGWPSGGCVNGICGTLDSAACHEDSGCQRDVCQRASVHGSPATAWVCTRHRGRLWRRQPCAWLRPPPWQAARLAAG